MRDSVRTPLRRLREFQPVAPRIGREEPPPTFYRGVPSALDFRTPEHIEECLDIAHRKRGMRLPRRPKGVLDADVELAVAHAKPAPAATPELRRLLDLLEPQQPAEEPACLGLAALWRGELYVVDVEHELGCS